MRKTATAARVFRDQGFAGILHVALSKLRILAGNRRSIDKLIRRHDPYSDDVRETLECPHCQGRLEKTVEGLLCRRCQDVYV